MSNHTQRSIFRNLSPLDHRYFLSNQELFEQLETYISEDGVVRYSLKVEGALLIAHLKRMGMDSPEMVHTVEKVVAEIEPEEVYREEEKTNHNIRALVNVMKKKLPEELSPYVHLGATSVDMMDTSSALRYRDVTL